MDTPEATALVLAVGYQESRFAARRQWPKGPARGFWQFEVSGGPRGVIGHEATRDHLKRAWLSLAYRDVLTPFALQEAIAHNDTLAFVCARLLLWTLPERLPTRDEPKRGLAQYLRAWRPGKPHPETWDDAWRIGWKTA